MTTEYGFEIDPRPAELGGGWRLRLIGPDGEEGGGVFPLVEYHDEEDPAVAAYADAYNEAHAWLNSRPSED